MSGYEEVVVAEAPTVACCSHSYRLQLQDHRASLAKEGWTQNAQEYRHRNFFPGSRLDNQKIDLQSWWRQRLRAKLVLAQLPVAETIADVWETVLY